MIKQQCFRFRVSSELIQQLQQNVLLTGKAFFISSNWFMPPAAFFSTAMLMGIVGITAIHHDKLMRKKKNMISQKQKMHLYYHSNILETPVFLWSDMVDTIYRNLSWKFPVRESTRNHSHFATLCGILVENCYFKSSVNSISGTHTWIQTFLLLSGTFLWHSLLPVYGSM